jgi:ABC-type branched-subunit amino acid transport system substrate-binding protein
MRRIVSPIPRLAALLWLLLATGACLAADTVKIAVLIGLSGPNAIYGEGGQLAGFNAAAELANARGGVLGGRKIEIVPMDNKGTPQESLLLLRKATDEKHINAADAKWERILLDYQARYKTNLDIAYLPAFRTVDMLVTAINTAGTLEPVRIARALEGMHYAGPTGDSWIRPEDHQMLAPMLIMSFVKAGQPGARHDIEGSGYGWKTDQVLSPNETAPPMRCRMERP